MLAAKFVPYEMKTCIVSIRSYEGKMLKGTVSNPYFEKPVAFDNAIQFVFLLDELQDAINFPQESMRARSFVAPDEAAPARDWLAASAPDVIGAPIASFKLNIMFRQNASWQGGITWIENRTEAQFRSLLELIMLLDSALTGVADGAD
jgi:hypothetical protein